MQFIVITFGDEMIRHTGVWCKELNIVGFLKTTIPILFEQYDFKVKFIRDQF
jgi:hypothetical protein